MSSTGHGRRRSARTAAHGDPFEGAITIYAGATLAGMPSEQREQWVRMARAALIIAAMRRSLLTYGELGQAIGMAGVDLRNQMRHVLARVAEECTAAGEPSLPALVVNATTGQPGSGWIDGAVRWHAEVQKLFRHWNSPR